MKEREINRVRGKKLKSIKKLMHSSIYNNAFLHFGYLSCIYEMQNSFSFENWMVIFLTILLAILHINSNFSLTSL